MAAAKFPILAEAGPALNQVLFPGAGVPALFGRYMLALAGYIALELVAQSQSGVAGAALGLLAAVAVGALGALSLAAAYRLIAGRDYGEAPPAALRRVGHAVLVRSFAQAGVAVLPVLGAHGLAQLFFAQPQLAVALLGLAVYPLGVLAGAALAVPLTPWRSWAALGYRGGPAASWRAGRGHWLRILAGYGVVALGVGVVAGFVILFGTYFAGQLGFRLGLPGFVADGLKLAIVGLAAFGAILATALYEAAWLSWLGVRAGPRSDGAPGEADSDASTEGEPGQTSQAEAV